MLIGMIKATGMAPLSEVQASHALLSARRGPLDLSKAPAFTEFFIVALTVFEFFIVALMVFVTYPSQFNP